MTFWVFLTGIPGCRNNRWRPRAVILSTVDGSGPLATSNFDNSRSALLASTSTTKMPETAPVAIATLRFGSAPHQLAIRSGSILASLKPCFVYGSLLPGLHGNTHNPFAASASAALIIGLVGIGCAPSGFTLVPNTRFERRQRQQTRRSPTCSPHTLPAGP